jgi:hypothetical protein
MGRSYERDLLFGLVEERKTITHSSTVVREAIGQRVKVGSRFSLPRVQLPSWTVKGARVLVTFEDGSPAVAINRYGKGTIVTVLPDAWNAAQAMPDLVRDVLDYANAARGTKPLVDVVGANENSDVAVQQTPGGFRVAVVNYGAREIELLLKAVVRVERGRWSDLIHQTTLGNSKMLKLKVPARGLRAVEFQ